jgi:hypothetical protein
MSCYVGIVWLDNKAEDIGLVYRTVRTTITCTIKVNVDYMLCSLHVAIAS